MGEFFTYEDSLPEGSGYECFSIEHLFCLLITLLIGFFIWKIYSVSDNKGRTIILRSLALFNLVVEILKDIVLIIIGAMSKYQLPLHICGLGLFVYLVNAFSNRNGRIFRISGEIAAVFILPAATAALLFPDWLMYPVKNFMNIHGYIGHGILVLYPILILTKKNEIVPSIKHSWWVIAYFFITAAIVYLFDIKEQVDYYFIYWAPLDTPLVYLRDFAGNDIGYRVLFILLILFMMMFMYILFYLKKIGEKNK